MSSYKLVISETVQVPIKLTANDNGKQREFAFTLTAHRMPQEALQAEMEAGDRTVTEILREKVIGWEGQRLVVEESTGEPAAFNDDSFAVMLSLMGAAGVIFNAYLKACGAVGKEKNSGR